MMSVFTRAEVPFLAVSRFEARRCRNLVSMDVDVVSL